MEEPTEIENWKRISVLGSGAFGVVTLWQHKDSQDYVAIKKCKFYTQSHISDRQKQRWDNEVQIMKTLDCPNIVSFKPLPTHLEAILLKYNPTKLPLLSMEYCTKGNLRHVLTQVKNLSGLQEQEVRFVLTDIANAVKYLHKFNITHRDIKPENIVLQQCDGRTNGIIYKLIDLGYAKELNDSVVSFVGTLHYLAPEIMKMEKYNYSVDYWSFGIVAFEVICGVLPFLPLHTPLERFSYLENKKPEHICIHQLHSGSVSYSTELLKENHISSCLKQNIEVWLRHVLQFDTASRGANFPPNVNVFDYLLNILNKKILTVFSVHTLELYSYEIDDSILVSTLKDWIARDTKVQKTEQVLLTNSERFDITDDKYVVEIVPTNDFSVYVFKKGEFINRERFKLPKYVSLLFENCSTKYKWRDLRHIYVKTLFFLHQEERLLGALKTAFRLCARYIQFLNRKLNDNLKVVYKHLSNTLVRVDCYHNLHKNNGFKLDSEYKIHLAQFQHLMVDLEKCIHSINDLLKKVNTLSKRQTILDEILPNVTPIITRCDFTSEIAKASDLVLKGSDKNITTPVEMVKTVSCILKIKDKLLNNKNFQSYSKAMLVAVKDVDELQDCMHSFHKYVQELSKLIDINQREQYQSLLSGLENKQVPAVSSHFETFVHWDLDSLIKENQDLRCRVEEVIGEVLIAQKIFCDVMKSDDFQNL